MSLLWWYDEEGCFRYARTRGTLGGEYLAKIRGRRLSGTWSPGLRREGQEGGGQRRGYGGQVKGLDDGRHGWTGLKCQDRMFDEMMPATLAARI